MKPQIISFLLFILLLTASPSKLYPQSMEQLYQSGLIKEEGEGELEQAIELYRKIVDDNSADNSLKAKALLHIGYCYEKLGTKEAVNAYRRIVKDFSRYKNEAAIAQARLSKLLPPSAKTPESPVIPKFTKIKIPTELSWGLKLSPDGKTLALVSDRKIWKVPLESNLGPDFPGAPVKLNTGDVEVEWTGLSWSGNGKSIAFNDYPQKDEKGDYKKNQSIYIVSADGGTPEKIIENFRDVRTINYRISLSPDGKELAFSSIVENEQHIFSISVAEGKQKQLVSMQAREPVYSPDGKFIAFVEDKDLGKFEGEQGLWIVSSEGGTPKLITEAGKASSPLWSPDGRMIAFLDYTRSTKIFLVRIDENGDKIGKVYSINAPEGTDEIRLIAGWTPDDKLGILLTSKRERGLYTLPAGGGQAAVVLNDCLALQPRCSPDGKKIFFTTLPPEGNNKNWRMTIASVPFEGGYPTYINRDPDKKDLKPFGAQGGNRISPDGKTIISAAWFTDDTLANIDYPGSHIWKISADGFQQTKLTHIDGPYVDLCPSWSPDGRQVAFVRYHLYENRTKILGEASLMTVKSSGGDPQLLFTETDKKIISPLWSPDGNMIAYLDDGKNDQDTKTLNVFNLMSGNKEILCEVPAAHFYIELAWSPDSKKIAFNDKEGEVIKVMSLSDGSIEDINTGLVDTHIRHLDWSPDGKRFVFSGEEDQDLREFWLLENFLPLDKLTQNDAEVSRTEGIVIKQVWTGPDVDNSGNISSDGKYLSFIDWETGDIAIRNLQTSENKLVTNEGTWDDPMHFADGCVMSSDASLIAYPWYVRENDFDLRIANLTTDNIDTVYPAQTGEEIYPLQWFPDNKKIVVEKYKSINDNAEISLGLMNVKTGEIEHLKKFKEFSLTDISISRDGKNIAYDFPNPDNNGNFDINLISADGEKEYSIVRHPAHDRLIGWLPNRDELLFTSDRSGTFDIWALPVPYQHPVSEAKCILNNIGDVYPMGLTAEGAFYYSIIQRKYDAFIVPFDQNAVKLTNDSRTPLLGSLLAVCWLPDGKSLLCHEFSSKAGDRGHYNLKILNVETMEKRSLAENIDAYGPPRLSPDGKSVLLFGYDKKRDNDKNYEGGIYNIDIKSGLYEEIKWGEDISGTHSIDWDATGDNIFFTNNDEIIQFNITTGDEKIIYSSGDNLGKGHPILKRSFDGNSLLVDIVENEDEQYLKSVSIKNGEVKTLCSIETHTPLPYKQITYSPDGEFIYYTQMASEPGSVVWRIPSEGGEPEKIWQSKLRIAGLSLNPDGNRMAISVFGKEEEIRVVENLAEEVERIFSKAD